MKIKHTKEIHYEVENCLKNFCIYITMQIFFAIVKKVWLPCANKKFNKFLSEMLICRLYLNFLECIYHISLFVLCQLFQKEVYKANISVVFFTVFCSTSFLKMLFDKLL